MEISPRLTRWINREFPKGSAEKVLIQLCELPRRSDRWPNPERIQASLVIRRAGDWYKFQQWLTLAKSDWRDALVGAGLGDEDWSSHLDAVLGTNE